MNFIYKVFVFIIITIIISGCVIFLKNPVIVNNQKANGDIFFHKELEETDQQLSRKQTEVNSSIRKQVGNSTGLIEVNDEIEQYDKEKTKQLKVVEKTLKSDSANSPKAKLEMLRVQLIDAKIRRTLCKNNHLNIQSDTLSSEQELREAKECWEIAEERVVKLIAEIKTVQ